MSRRHHKRRRALAANRELYRSLDDQARAQIQLSTVSEGGMTRRVLEILDEISKESREGGALTK
jgi:hypothetical protein